MTPNYLGHRHIVVTRPKEQSTHFCEMLIDCAAVPVRFPVLAISPVENKSPLLDASLILEHYQFVVFVSPNAVQHALAVMLRDRSWPPAVSACVMGRSSEAALARFGVTVVIAPETTFDSESLLAMPPMQDVKGKRVLVCRGDGGRELLGETLTARGAQVDYLTCYHRAQAPSDPAPLLRLWQEARLDAVTLTSSEGVRYFAAMVGHLGQAYWRATPTFVSHQRIADEAAHWKLREIILTKPGDAGLLAGLQEYFSTRPARD